MKEDLLLVRHLANDEIVAGFQKALGVSDLPGTLTTYIPDRQLRLPAPGPATAALLSVVWFGDPTRPHGVVEM